MEEDREAPKIEAVELPEVQPGEEAEAPAPDPLELDVTEGAPTAEGGALPEPSEPVQPGLLDWAADHWIWLAVSLFVLSVALGGALWIVHVERQKSRRIAAPRFDKREITASLGGEHYVRFTLWGPFGDPAGRSVLGRAMPKIRDELILSGGRSEVARAIQAEDRGFLSRYIRGVVSRVTGMPAEELEIRGLVLVPFSDAPEVKVGD